MAVLEPWSVLCRVSVLRPWSVIRLIHVAFTLNLPSFVWSYFQGSHTTLEKESKAVVVWINPKCTFAVTLPYIRSQPE